MNLVDQVIRAFLTEFKPIHWSFNWDDIIEILIILAFIVFFYQKFIKNTSSERLFRGLLFLVGAWILGEVFVLINLEILGFFIKFLVAIISLSLVVIFQPELRRLLGYLGQHGFFYKGFWHNNHSTNSPKTNVLKEVLESVKYFSKTRTGCLIVFQKEMSPAIYSDVGTKLNADVSAELILTIFHTNTPLHDGAMVIKNDKILSAGVLLPLTEDPKLSWKYGTRHRAAIGLTEISDSACLVVSEETGDISVCLDGVIKKYEDMATLKKDLEVILEIKQDDISERKPFFNINNFIQLKRPNKISKIKPDEEPKA